MTLEDHWMLSRFTTSRRYNLLGLPVLSYYRAKMTNGLATHEKFFRTLYYHDRNMVIFTTSIRVVCSAKDLAGIINYTQQSAVNYECGSRVELNFWRKALQLHPIHLYSHVSLCTCMLIYICIWSWIIYQHVKIMQLFEVKHSLLTMSTHLWWQKARKSWKEKISVVMITHS